MNYLQPLLSNLADPSNNQGNVYTAKSIYDRLEGIYEHGHLMGTTSYIRTLDDHFRWRDGFLYAFSGFPGAGKSTFLNYLMMLRAKNDNRKVAMYSPESYPIEDLAEELCRMYVEGNIADNYPNKVDRETFDAAVNFVSEHFYFLDFDEIPSIQNVFQEFERLILNEGVGSVIIDPFNAIAEGADSSAGGLSQYLKAALTQSKMFAVHHDIPVILVEHPRSTGSISSAAERPPASPFMIYGGSMWWNKVDVFTTIDRNMVDDPMNPVVEVRVWKVKKQRQMGRPGTVMLQFDIKKTSYE